MFSSSIAFNHGRLDVNVRVSGPSSSSYIHVHANGIYRIFNKVKSRSAHMKSHRAQDTEASAN